MKAQRFFGECAIDQEPAAACQALCNRRPGWAAHGIQGKGYSLAARERLHPLFDRFGLRTNRSVTACLEKFLCLFAATDYVDGAKAKMPAQPDDHPSESTAGRGLQQPGSRRHLQD